MYSRLSSLNFPTGNTHLLPMALVKTTSWSVMPWDAGGGLGAAILPETEWRFDSMQAIDDDGKCTICCETVADVATPARLRRAPDRNGWAGA
jgi:hypothetical protein